MKFKKKTFIWLIIMFTSCGKLAWAMILIEKFRDKEWWIKKLYD